MPADEIEGDRFDLPLLERRLFLLDPPWPQSEVRERHLCRHRSPCYAQEERLPAPFVCTYLAYSRKGSGRPFRFILNHSEAVAANVYLMLYPKDRMQRAMGARPELKRGIRKRLNGINPQTMLDEGRVYGGGLHKLEPKELGKVAAAAIAALCPELAQPQRNRQTAFFQGV